MKRLTPEQQNNPIPRFFNETHSFMGHMADRWKDESEYENIEDYKKELQKRAQPFGITITKMTKRPFGCLFTHDGATYEYKVKGRQICLDSLT